jgi:hypothetical protein
MAKKNPKIGPDGIPRGWLDPEWREGIVKAKITDPKEIKRILDQKPSALKLGLGANTVRRRGRYAR